MVIPGPCCKTKNQPGLPGSCDLLSALVKIPCKDISGITCNSLESKTDFLKPFADCDKNKATDAYNHMHDCLCGGGLSKGAIIGIIIGGIAFISLILLIIYLTGKKKGKGKGKGSKLNK